MAKQELWVCVGAVAKHVGVARRTLKRVFSDSQAAIAAAAGDPGPHRQCL